jgi:hypothetical protein
MADREGIRDEMASEQAEQGKTNVITEDVCTADDSLQVVVATRGDLIAKRVSSGSRSTQFVGQMSDASLQQLSRDRSQSAIDQDIKPLTATTTEIINHYGPGHVLGPQS